MRNYSKILGFGLFVFFVLSLLFSFYKFYVVRDYMVYGHAECDPTVSVCFVYECDPESEECSENPEENVEYYTLIEKNASQIPVCDPHEEDCAPLSCADGEEDCVITFCSDEALAGEEGAYCSDPIDFMQSEEEVEEEVLEQAEPEVIEGGEAGLMEEPLEVVPETTAPAVEPNTMALPPEQVLE